LHVRHVAAKSDDGLVAEHAQTLGVCEAGEGSIGGCNPMKMTLDFVALMS
jgi:hypothetical protein